MRRRKKHEQEDATGALAVLALCIGAVILFAFWASDRPRVPDHVLDCNKPNHSRR